MNAEEGPFNIEPCDVLSSKQVEKFVKAKNSIHIAESVYIIESMLVPSSSRIYKIMAKLHHRGAERGKDFVIEKTHGGTEYFLHTTSRFISIHEDII